MSTTNSSPDEGAPSSLSETERDALELIETERVVPEIKTSSAQIIREKTGERGHPIGLPPIVLFTLPEGSLITQVDLQPAFFGSGVIKEVQAYLAEREGSWSLSLHPAVNPPEFEIDTKTGEVKAYLSIYQKRTRHRSGGGGAGESG